MTDFTNFRLVRLVGGRSLSLAVANIQSFWRELTAAIDPPHHLNMEAWNLDTGQSAEEPERLVFWPVA